MSWSIVYLIVAIIAGFLGIWNLARQRSVFLPLAGILWFLIVLTSQYVRQVYDFALPSGMPHLGSLLLYVLLPILMILGFFAIGTRRG